MSTTVDCCTLSAVRGSTTLSAAAARPSAISRRGRGGNAPENTLLAFRQAIEAGADAVEADLRQTADGVVVISFDNQLSRHYGTDKRVSQTSWESLRRLRTTSASSGRVGPQPMARLADLLGLLSEPGFRHAWAVLNIQDTAATDADDSSGAIYAAIAAVVRSSPPAKGAQPWADRLQLSCLTPRQAQEAGAHLPACGLMIKSFSPWFARSYFALARERQAAAEEEDDDEKMNKNEKKRGSSSSQQPPRGPVSFSMAQEALASPFSGGRQLARDARGPRLRAPLYLRGVDEAGWMEWAVRRGVVDGVFTDRPALFREVRDRVLLGDDDEGPVPDEVAAAAAAVSYPCDAAPGPLQLALESAAGRASTCLAVLLFELLHLLWVLVALCKGGQLYPA